MGIPVIVYHENPTDYRMSVLRSLNVRIHDPKRRFTANIWRRRTGSRLPTPSSPPTKFIDNEKRKIQDFAQRAIRRAITKASGRSDINEFIGTDV
jgi:hypothetical protein